MTLHLVKLCVGCDGVDEVRAFTRRRAEQARRAGGEPESWHWTRMVPRRRDELLDGGSLYWVIRGYIRARQRLTGVDEELDSEGRRMCRLRLDPEVVRVEPRAQRAFQGWRYLQPADAPPDLADAPPGVEHMPAEMVAELRELGLL